MRKFLIIFLGFSLVLLGASLVGAQSWYDPDWSYRVPVDISNPSVDTLTTLTDYQVLVTLDSSFNFGNAHPEGDDLRVTDRDGENPLPFWIEEWDTDTPDSETARIWVKVPSIPVIGTTVYLYYGNPGASSASDGSETFIFFDSFEDFDSAGMNAPTYLNTPTYEESGQVVHPDIAYIPGGWNEYEYWMAMTPYPNGNASFENPSIIASHDGISWEVPTDLINPLVSGGSRADPDLLLVDGTMICYYMHRVGTSPSVYRMTSTDGVNWSSPQAVITVNGGYLLSPTVLYEGGTYYMWYVRSATGCSDTSSDVYMRTSSDGITWSDEETPVTISHPGNVIWHPDIQKVGTKYVMLTADYPVGSSCGNTSLYYAESTDGTNWTDPTLILAPSSSGWDNGEIYRASFLAEQLGDDTYLWIWYSARSSGGQWHVGYTEGYVDEFISSVQGEGLWDEITGDVSATTDHPRSGEYGLRQARGSTYPAVHKYMTGRFSFNAWLYDDLSTTSLLLSVSRVYDQFPASSIGVGFYTGASTDHYSYHTVGYTYTETEIPRTSGWHKLSINVKENTCDLLLDDAEVASLDVLDESNISRVSLVGYVGGVGWFDDVYVRQYVDLEPSVTNIGDEEVPVIEVAIDIKPGSYPNSINLGSHGVIPVAILSSATFDAASVDPATVTLGGSGVAVRGKGSRLMAHEADVDGDGLVDLVVQVETENLNPEGFQAGYATLKGKTYDGMSIEGEDEITIVPPE